MVKGGIFICLGEALWQKINYSCYFRCNNVIGGWHYHPTYFVASAVEGFETWNSWASYRTNCDCNSFFIIFLSTFRNTEVGIAFGPAMIIWFTMLFVLGISQIMHYPEIFKALNPVYGYRLLAEYPHGFWLLGAVFLCTTGAEALYSDLGHCGRKNIDITWAFVKICLLVNYMGQAAWIMHQGQPFLDGRNPFF